MKNVWPKETTRYAHVDCQWTINSIATDGIINLSLMVHVTHPSSINEYLLSFLSFYDVVAISFLVALRFASSQPTSYIPLSMMFLLYRIDADFSTCSRV